MHSAKKNTKWYFGMRVHIGTDPYYGFVHNIISTVANKAEGKVAPGPLREDDTVVYGDASYLKMDKYVTDGIECEYKINRQRGPFKRHYGDGLAWQYEKELEKMDIQRSLQGGICFPHRQGHLPLEETAL